MSSNPHPEEPAPAEPPRPPQGADAAGAVEAMVQAALCPSAPTGAAPEPAPAGGPPAASPPQAAAEAPLDDAAGAAIDSDLRAAVAAAKAPYEAPIEAAQAEVERLGAALAAGLARTNEQRSTTRDAPAAPTAAGASAGASADAAPTSEADGALYDDGDHGGEAYECEAEYDPLTFEEYIESTEDGEPDCWPYDEAKAHWKWLGPGWGKFPRNGPAKAEWWGVYGLLSRTKQRLQEANEERARLEYQREWAAERAADTTPRDARGRRLTQDPHLLHERELIDAAERASVGHSELHAAVMRRMGGCPDGVREQAAAEWRARMDPTRQRTVAELDESDELMMICGAIDGDDPGALERLAAYLRRYPRLRPTQLAPEAPRTNRRGCSSLTEALDLAARMLHEEEQDESTDATDHRCLAGLLPPGAGVALQLAAEAVLKTQRAVRDAEFGLEGDDWKSPTVQKCIDSLSRRASGALRDYEAAMRIDAVQRTTWPKLGPAAPTAAAVAPLYPLRRDAPAAAPAARPAERPAAQPAAPFASFADLFANVGQQD
ncbi:hypothetical protein Pla175_30280 [Pirellulimonas nuda]|uniref:Uncharacterized protein n=1 Tax=Pirellulimonas nuda TaxID=2528009 RepID=A0A518DDS7_9BACT|nr:hypothetical protein [Pirellulimonas nuda]QDU89635.1 hypothetical protein Pla175_30280 [Pirellulimonas nuda]